MEANAKTSTDDPGFFVLEILLRLLGVGTDPDQLRRHVGYPAVGVKEMIGYARKAGLAARCSKSSWKKLPKHHLPGIAVLRNGSFLLLGKVTGETAIVLAPRAARPSLMTRAEFEAVWDNRLVLIRKRSVLAARLQRYRQASITRANDISGRLVERLHRATKPRVEKAMQLGASGGGTAVIVFADHARKLGRAVARLKPDEDRRR